MQMKGTVGIQKVSRKILAESTLRYVGKSINSIFRWSVIV